jgi:hypothetical protein
MHKLVLLEEIFCICRLDPQRDLPRWALQDNSFFSVTKTRDELSVVCPERCVPPGVRHEEDFRCLKIEGPLDFSLVGVLAPIANLLAGVQISIFTISTYDTDYIMVRQSSLDGAVGALASAGYAVVPDRGDAQ